jgi:superfamily I DNA/RNA helicase
VKEKILSALKTAVQVNGKTSISDKTLEAYANLISAQITDESQISESIKPHVAVLKEIQGNIDHVAAESTRVTKTELEKQIEELKKSILQKSEASKEVITKADMEAFILEKIGEVTKPIEAEKKRTERMNEIASKAKELGLEDSDMRYVTVPEEGDITAFLTGFKQHLVERGLKPLGSDVRQAADPKDSLERASEWLSRISVDGEKK